MNSEKIEIRGKNFSYPVFLGNGLLGQIGLLAKDASLGPRCAIIADGNTTRLFARPIQNSLQAQQFQPVLISVPAGENTKSLGAAGQICETMAKAGLDRTSFIVGVGGGVVGDLSGFVAAIFHRGIRHVQTPTTLLAMVDSAIGGKTGVNLEAGKNLIGAFHHPSLVVVDLEALASLSPRELRQGYAEIVKHGIIRDAGMVRDLETKSLSLAEIVQRNILIKAEIVSVDERDLSGERALLNFGHTIGHAIERAADFKIPHGDCVSLGMIGACRISIKRARFTPDECQRVIALLKQFDLPTQIPRAIPRTRVLESIPRDKKFEAGQIRFVLTSKLGSAHVSREVTMDDVREAIDTLY